MKQIFQVILVVFAANSLIIFAEAGVEGTDADYPNELILLSQQLEQIDARDNDRDSRLRLERAEYYYQRARLHYESGLIENAKNKARRGLSLVALEQQAQRAGSSEQQTVAVAQSSLTAEH